MASDPEIGYCEFRVSYSEYAHEACVRARTYGYVAFGWDAVYASSLRIEREGIPALPCKFCGRLLAEAPDLKALDPQLHELP